MRTLLATVVVLSTVVSPALSQNTKDLVERREPVFAETMGVMAIHSLWEGRLINACVEFTFAIVHGRTKYKDRLAGVKLVMLPAEIEECQEKAREFFLRRALETKAPRD